MASIKTLFAAAIVAVGLANAATPAQVAALRQCGDAYYNPADYKCYGGKKLCPVFDGVADKPCGRACYSQYQYSCANKTLSQLPPVTNNSYTLTAINPTAPQLHNQPIQAAGQRFYVGGNPATYCPSVAGSICSTFPNNETVIYASGGALAVEVPGGQQAYTQTSGAWAFVQAHTIDLYNVSAYYIGSALEGGGLLGANNSPILACPVSSSGSNQTSWQVFSELDGVIFPSDCVGIYAKVNLVPSGTLGAWQYT